MRKSREIPAAEFLVGVARRDEYFNIRVPFGHKRNNIIIYSGNSDIESTFSLLGRTGCLDESSAPHVAREMIPVLSWQMATKPISDNIARTIIPDRQAMSDTHRELYFARWTRNNRLVTGGAAIVPGPGGDNLRPTLAARLKRLWPQIGDVDFDYIWSGFIGITPDSLLHPEISGFPRVLRLGRNGFAWAGCNGRAVGLAISLGRELARSTQGVSIETLGLPLSEPKPQPFQATARRVAVLALPLYRALDRREI
jgi:glycine/D-amino acid oxidase-like deaminating enzyme